MDRNYHRSSYQLVHELDLGQNKNLIPKYHPIVVVENLCGIVMEQEISLGAKRITIHK